MRIRIRRRPESQRWFRFCRRARPSAGGVDRRLSAANPANARNALECDNKRYFPSTKLVALPRRSAPAPRLFRSIFRQRALADKFVPGPARFDEKPARA